MIWYGTDVLTHADVIPPPPPPCPPQKSCLERICRFVGGWFIMLINLN